MRYQMKQKNIKERSENKVDRTLMQELAKIEGVREFLIGFVCRGFFKKKKSCFLCYNRRPMQR